MLPTEALKDNEEFRKRFLVLTAGEAEKERLLAVSIKTFKSTFSKMG